MKMHHDRTAVAALTRRHAGHVTCGVNAGRRNRTDDPEQVTCEGCLDILTRPAVS